MYAFIADRLGYHPWFTHRYSLLPSLPSKEDHYTSLFFTPKSDPNSKNRTLLRSLLPYLPDPIHFQPLLDKLRADIQASLDQGNLTMLGEIGLDSQARMRWPTDPAARDLYAAYLGEKGKEMDPYEETKDGEWKRLTPFKTDMKHQRRIVEMQMEVAVELGVNVSFHCVAAPGELFCTLG
jgi:Tat protein secretion system quality control protein TatD with DNase activity